MNLDQAQKTKYDTRKDARTQVSTVSMDDIIGQLQPNESVYMIKIDVQGHESHVFEGLLESLAQGKVKYVLFEYWPNALDDASNRLVGSCSGVHNILVPLVNLGYTLLDLTVSHHPAVQDKKGLGVDRVSAASRPLEFDSNCRWFVEKGLKTPNYEMGYWTDILAARDEDISTLLQYMKQNKAFRQERIYRYSQGKLKMR